MIQPLLFLMVLIGIVLGGCNIDFANQHRHLSSCEDMRNFCTALVDECSETINGELVWQKDLGYILCEEEFGTGDGCQNSEFDLQSMGE